MNKIEKILVAPGVHWVAIPDEDLYILCGCPADSVKHLMKKGLINTVETDDLSYETGPNAILLSDLKLQNGHFANLAEFPILQMLYRQGMLIPNHPNNTGIKPILIGREEVVDAQMKYIYRGNYGLTSEEEMVVAGIETEKAAELMRLKLSFAFGQIHPSEDLLEGRPVYNEKVEVRNGVEVSRLATNHYCFHYKGEKAEVDLNLRENEDYQTPYELSYHHFKREYFSVVHTGEGDGWDVNRPCMSSILCFQGRIYLIDAGPNIFHSLNASGIDINEVEGLFHTHAHDDHFAGLTTLIRADHRIKYYSTPLVRESVTRKLSALMSIEKDSFSEFFDVHDLEFDTWNNIEGLEVRPVFSPHPVETNVFFFRTLWTNGYVEYAHFADIASIDVLEGMITEDVKSPGISRKMFHETRENYLIPVQLKKIDIGGGLIHGKAEDFADDGSEKIVLSHTALELTNEQKMCGTSVSFGTADVLIPGAGEYSMREASNFLMGYFPDIPKSDIYMLLNCGHQVFSEGSLLLRNNERASKVYLILTGTVEFISAEDSHASILSSGSLIGDIEVLLGYNNFGNYRALSYVDALVIPGSLYKDFVTRNEILDEIKHTQDTVEFLHQSWLFGESVSSPIKTRIAHKTDILSFKKGESIPTVPGINMLRQGEVELISKAGNGAKLKVKPGEFWGEEAVLNHESSFSKTEACENSTIFQIRDLELLREIPIVRWKMLEHWEKRLKALE